MANVKRNTELVRVNFNLPAPIVEKVRAYADELGLGITSTYTFIIQSGLEQRETMKQLPNMVEAFKQALEMQEKQEIKDSNEM